MLLSQFIIYVRQLDEEVLLLSISSVFYKKKNLFFLALSASFHQYHSPRFTQNDQK
jgi:hypothetical protein